MDEIRVSASIVKGSITFDYAGTKSRLESILTEYQDMTIESEDSIKFAKGILADLREGKKQFDARRKDVKKEWDEPYNEFEKQAKEIIELFDKPINSIDSQVKELENRKKQEKLQKVKEIYSKNVDNLKEYMEFEQIFEEKWLNSTVTLAKIEKEILEIREKVETEVEAIKETGSAAVKNALNNYKRNKDFLIAMRMIKDYESAKVEEEKKKAVEEYKKEMEIKETVKEEVIKEIFEIKEQKKDSVTKMVKYNVNVTDEEKEQLEMYMNSIGIEFEENFWEV
jgi:hypothetical protein